MVYGFFEQMREKTFDDVYRAPVDSLYEALGTALAPARLAYDSTMPCTAPLRATDRHSSKSSSPPADPANAVQPTERFARCERLLSQAAWASASDRQTSMQNMRRDVPPDEPLFRHGAAMAYRADRLRTGRLVTAVGA
jgi:hypothetical protein